MKPKSIRGKKPVKFRPSFEPLEDRSVPAGNVFAAMFDGVLYLNGDADSNAVGVFGTGGNKAFVRSLDGTTTINGQTAIEVTGIRRGVHATLGDGNDTLILQGLRLNNSVFIDGGAGADNIQLSNLNAGKGAIIVGGTDADSLTATGSKFGNLFSFVGGDGDDHTSLAGNQFNGAALFNGGAGSNTVTASKNNFSHGFRQAGFVPGAAPVVPTVPDTTAPVTSLTTTATNPSLLGSIPFNVNFSKPVSGFTASDINVGNGTVSGFTTTNAANYTFNVVPAADGAISVNIPAGAATDASGNPSTAASSNITSLRTDAGMVNTKPDTSGADFVALGNQGLKIKDIVVGTGTAVTASSTITNFYTGWLSSNGTQFDSSRTTGSPAVFQLSNLIQGYQQAAIGMKPGGIRQVFIPSALGYGAAGSPPSIPANADLVFEIKILATT